MVARLWWKDARQFWPIWVFIAAIALAAQWLALHYFGVKARSGELAVAALGWTCLYAFRKFPPMPNAAEPIRAEAQIMRNMEKLPQAELVEKIFDLKTQGRNHPDMWMDKLWVDLVTTPWELARTGRAFRLLLASKIEAAQYAGPWVSWRPGGPLNLALITGTPGRILDFAALPEIEQSTPLVQTILPPIDRYLDYRDHNEAERRALVQILALRVWQLRHDGRLPWKLQDLVTSGVLAELPADPYTPGHPFGYVRSFGQALLPLGQLGPIQQGFEANQGARSTLGSWLLYSVGPDRQDDGARTNETNTGSGDLIFPLAESTTGETQR